MVHSPCLFSEGKSLCALEEGPGAVRFPQGASWSLRSVMQNPGLRVGHCCWQLTLGKAKSQKSEWPWGGGGVVKATVFSLAPRPVCP